MASFNKLNAYFGDWFDDPTLYRSTIESLQYLSFTCPDLAFTISKVYQGMHAPCLPHWTMVKRILRYLKSTSTLGLQVFPSASSTITTFLDADWASCPNNRRSTSGFFIFFCTNLISWSFKKQPTVSRSSFDVEFKTIVYSC